MSDFKNASSSEPVTSTDDNLSALRNGVEDLTVALAIWENRSEPDANARRAANTAMDAVDGMLTELHEVRARLIGEIRRSDDATAARVDALLRSRGEV